MLRMNDCHYGDEELLVILKRKDTKVVREVPMNGIMSGPRIFLWKGLVLVIPMIV